MDTFISSLEKKSKLEAAKTQIQFKKASIEFFAEFQNVLKAFAASYEQYERTSDYDHEYNATATLHQEGHYYHHEDM